MIKFLNWLGDLRDYICEGVGSIVSNTALWKTVYNIADFIGIIAGIIVSVIAIVTFLGSYYFKRIKILGWHKSTNISDGHKFGVSIQNRCLSTLSIQRVSIILDNIEEVVLFYPKIVFADNPTTSPRSVEPFKTDVFTSEGSTIPLFEKGGLENYKKIVFCFTYSDNTQTKVRYRLKKIKKNKYKTMIPKQMVFRGVRLTEYMRYIVEYRDSSKVLVQCVVYGNGLISDKIENVHQIPQEHLISSESLKSFLESSISGTSFDVYYNQYYKQG